MSDGGQQPRTCSARGRCSCEGPRRSRTARKEAGAAWSAHTTDSSRCAVLRQRAALQPARSTQRRPATHRVEARVDGAVAAAPRRDGHVEGVERQVLRRGQQQTAQVKVISRCTHGCTARRLITQPAALRWPGRRSQNGRLQRSTHRGAAEVGGRALHPAREGRCLAGRHQQRGCQQRAHEGRGAARSGHGCTRALQGRGSGLYYGLLALLACRGGRGGRGGSAQQGPAFAPQRNRRPGPGSSQRNG